MVSKGVLGTSWGRLGVFGSPWVPKSTPRAVLEATWAVLVASWAVLGAAWARLGPSWSGLGAKLGPSGRLGRVIWRQDGTKSRSKNRSKLRSYFKIDFWSYPGVFGTNMFRFWAILGALDFQKPYILKFVGRRFGRQLFRPRGAPRGRRVVQDGRPTRKVRAAGRTMEGFEETWTETLERDTLEVEQRICSVIWHARPRWGGGSATALCATA